jgi:choline dehydrogenase-like flavoprotein
VIGVIHPTRSQRIEADAAIIGSGPAGFCVADVLTRAGLSVVMFEEGPFVPLDAAPAKATEAFPLTWRCAGLTAAMGRPPVAYVEGCCVGGGSEINSAIFQRTDPMLLDLWAKLYKIEDFGQTTLAPYYDRAAAVVNASSTAAPLGYPSDLLTQAAERLGWASSTLDRAQRHCVGTNLCAFVCPTGGKQSMSNTLLPEAIGRGLRVFAHSRVDRLIMEGRRVIKADATVKSAVAAGIRLEIRADRFFVCAGAIQTPALLRRSGLRHRIGRTLRLHPTIKCTAVFDAPVDAHLYRLPLVVINEFMPDQRIGGSLFTPAIFALALAEDWERRSPLMVQWRNCATYYAMIRPLGIGSVVPLPGCREPLVRYVLAPEDWIVLGQALSHLGEAMFAAGARLVIPSISGHPGWRTAAEVHQYWDTPLPRNRTNLMSIHLFGSCPPGEDALACATDSYGRVRAIENLVVTDGSSIPEAPGVNPQATIMAMAFRTAEAALAITDRGRRRAADREAA